MCLCNCGMSNIKFVSLAYMHVTKSAKCEVVLQMCPCVSCVCPFVCVYLYCECGVPDIKKISIYGMNVS